MKNKMLITLSIFLSFLFILDISRALESDFDTHEVALVDKISALL